MIYNIILYNIHVPIYVLNNNKHIIYMRNDGVGTYIYIFSWGNGGEAYKSTAYNKI